jgi:2EXR family
MGMRKKGGTFSEAIGHQSRGYNRHPSFILTTCALFLLQPTSNTIIFHITMDINESTLIRLRHMEEEQGWKTLEDMQEELRYHGLPDEGSKSVLMDRLYTDHEEIWGPEGRKLDYERRLEVYRKERLAEIVPILEFKKFPKDIRLVIWEQSLPGPRTICPGHAPRPLPLVSPSGSVSLDGGEPSNDASDPGASESSLRKLYFPKSHHTSNPAALAVCRESRYIVLQHYKSCFGSPNVYADLNIDILYFIPWMCRDSVTCTTCNASTSVFRGFIYPLLS